MTAVCLIAGFLVVFGGPLLAANHYVRQAAAGTGTGLDWTNACTDFSGSCAVASLVRGDTYYVAGGTYAATTFNRATSGALLITIKKATVADHGIATGWSDAYGTAQAHWTDGLSFTTSYWVFDGVTGSGTDTTSYGFVLDQTCDGFVIGTGVGTTFTTFTLSHIYALACAADNEKLFLQTGFQVGQTDNVTVSFSLLNGWQNGVMARGQSATHNGWVFDHNQCLNGYSSSANHGEWINANSANLNTMTISHNVFRGHTGSSGQTGTIVANNSNLNNAKIYGNVFDGLQVGNGVITGTSAGDLNNAVVYNNTFLNLTGDSGNAIGGTGQGTGNVAWNNLLYNMDASVGGGFTTNFNAYFSCTNLPTEANRQSASANPFVNSAAFNYHLAAANTAGTTLSSPYTTDPDGTTRGSDGTWDRGAYEYQAATTFISGFRLFP